MITTSHDEKRHQYYDSIYARGYATHAYYPLYDQIIKIIECFEHRKKRIFMRYGDDSLCLKCFVDLLCTIM